MNRYIYPAIFEFAEEGGYTVTYPDLPGCITEGDTLEESLQMAREALELHLYGMEKDNDEIPLPSKPETIVIPQGSFIALVEASMPHIRNKMQNKAIKKTLTLPKWLNDIAEENGVNFSQVLQSSLKDILGISDNFKS